SKGLLKTNVCARREQKPSLLGLCRAAANFRASECNRACSYCRAQPKISKQIFVQASAIELAHIAERSRKSQSKFSGKRVQNRTCSGYAERSRKCREKVHF
ncbi:MAG: hypothetical protein PUF44_04295, partial [Bacteroidales bacterium]|nr:hypothetical protein [Bacteroidales bacterium]